MQLRRYAAICEDVDGDLNDTTGTFNRREADVVERKMGWGERDPEGLKERQIQRRDHYLACPTGKHTSFCVQACFGHAVFTLPLKVLFNNVNVPHWRVCLFSAPNCFWPVLPLLLCTESQ